MASTTLIPVSDACRCFQQSRGRSQIGYKSGGALSSSVCSNISLSRTNHTASLIAARRPTVVCLRSSKTAAVTWQSWDKLVLKNESPVLVEFYASWCGPCQMVHRVIDEIAMEYRGKLNCFVLNTDNDLAIAEEYDIKAVPVVLLFKHGRKHASIVGTMPKEFYVAAVEKLLAS